MNAVPAALLAVSFVAALSAQTAQAPAPNRLIEAQDGDVIVVRNSGTIRLVNRTEGTVRAIYNAQQRWIVVLFDKDATGMAGRVDVAYTFTDVEGTWPFGERWEGTATVDEYSILGGPAAGLGLTTGNGLVQLLTGARGIREARQRFRDASAVAVMTFSGSGRGGGGNQTLDDAERQQIASATRNAANVPAGVPPAIGGPVRVGGNIRTPARIQDAEPVLPDTARQAGIRGVVILEIMIAPDGQVSDAKVLRSIPLLDAAAIEAARKWRYEPTYLNGTAVPVLVTATVNFR